LAIVIRPTNSAAGVVKSVEKKARVAGQFAVKLQTNVFLNSRTKQGRLRDRQVLVLLKLLADKVAFAKQYTVAYPFPSRKVST
jgi:hypothetical protein